MIVLDTSAVMAVLLEERGADVVLPQMRRADISIVNMAEILTKFAEQGGDIDEVRDVLRSFELRVQSFEETHAREVARLRPLTKHFGLGIGDRACLAQASMSDLPVLTADKDWAKLDIGLDIRLIR